MYWKTAAILLFCATLIAATSPIDQHVADLDHADPARREAATAALIRLGEAALPALDALIESSPAPELATRARRLVDLSRAGQPANGLALRLSSDVARIADGQTVTLTTELANVGSTPMTLYVGYTTSGVDFESGGALRMLAHEVATRDEPLAPKWKVGFCGTGAYPIFKTLAPGETVSYELPITVDVKAGVLLLGKHRYTTLPAPDARAKVIRLRLRHVVVDSQNRNVGFMPQNERPDASANLWTGEVQSNLVELALDHADVNGK